MGGWGQGDLMAELLGAFDAVGAEHEGMAADTFNDDGTYKNGINQVLPSTHGEPAPRITARQW